mmetsp:Transcript_6241/g.6991  ORF Transcript_6241/g.6991 Transcript_6241/m.6991 type:complete len:96 (+) Transcript_6241:1-288(+)
MKSDRASCTTPGDDTTNMDDSPASPKFVNDSYHCSFGRDSCFTKELEIESIQRAKENEKNKILKKFDRNSKYPSFNPSKSTDFDVKVTSPQDDIV